MAPHSRTETVAFSRDDKGIKDLAAMVAGTNAFLAALDKVFPDATPEEQLERLHGLEQSGVARELLHMVFGFLKVRL